MEASWQRYRPYRALFITVTTYAHAPCDVVVVFVVVVAGAKSNKSSETTP
jgi:hypothetical protein